MHQLLSRLLLSAALLAPLAQAAELKLELPQGSRSWSTAQLLTHPQAQQIEIAADVAYKRAMSYRAVPLAALLDGVQPGDHLQAVALDGFAAELPAAPLLSTQGARAWLAVEDPAQPWPALSKNKPSAGPFYLVWQNPEAARFAGMPVNAVLVKTALLSGGLAALAGWSEVAGLKGHLSSDLSPGFGYTGIIVAMLALLHPLGVILTAIFVAGIFVGSDAMSRAAGVPTYIADMLMATALLFMVLAILLTKVRVVRG